MISPTFKSGRTCPLASHVNDYDGRGSSKPLRKVCSDFHILGWDEICWWFAPQDAIFYNVSLVDLS